MNSATGPRYMLKLLYTGSEPESSRRRLDEEASTRRSERHRLARRGGRIRADRARDRDPDHQRRDLRPLRDRSTPAGARGAAGEPGVDGDGGRREADRALPRACCTTESGSIDADHGRCSDAPHTHRRPAWADAAAQLTRCALLARARRPSACRSRRAGDRRRTAGATESTRTSDALDAVQRRGRAVKRVTVDRARLDDRTGPPLARLVASFDLATGCISDRRQTLLERLKPPLTAADRRSPCRPSPTAPSTPRAPNALGEIQATDLSAARDALRGNGLLAQTLEELRGAGRRRRPGLVRPHEEGQAEVAAGVLAPVRDDDRGGAVRRDSARDPRAADRR